MQQMIVPTVNMKRDASRSARRPNTSDKAPRNGRKTALESRYDVPAQKVSIADPFNSFARVCCRLASDAFLIVCSIYFLWAYWEGWN